MAETYEVISQEEALDVDDVTNPRRIMLVKFRTTQSNVPATVRIPLADYTPDRVRTEIEKYVANIDAVHNL